MAKLRIHHNRNAKGFFILRISDRADMGYARGRINAALGIEDNPGLTRAGQVVPDNAPVSDYDGQDINLE